MLWLVLGPYVREPEHAGMYQHDIYIWFAALGIVSCSNFIGMPRITNDPFPFHIHDYVLNAGYEMYG